MKWVEKYAPKSLGDVLGNTKLKAQIETWAKKWVRGEEQPPLLLVGPPGVGKTTMAHLVGDEYFSETIEVNASDKRSYDIIKKTVGESAQTQSLFQDGKKLIIIDEVDGISGRDDRGGSRAINEIIKNAKQPVILMANDPYSKNIASIKRNAEVLKFTKIRSNSLTAQLKRICQQEDITYDPDVLVQLAKQSSGDLRSAITTLQAIVDDKKITQENLDVVSQKNIKQNVFDTLRTILKSKTPEHVKDAMNTDGEPQFLIELLAENIPREYEKTYEIARAYEMISLADVNLGRAFRTQDYTYWKYAFLFMGRGVADAKDETYHKFVPYKNSTVYSRLSKSRKKRNLLKDVTQKMSRKLHTSPKQLEVHISYFSVLFEDNEVAYDLKEYFKLTDDEVKLFRSRKIPASIAKKREKQLQKLQKEHEKQLQERLKQQEEQEKLEKLKIQEQIDEQQQQIQTNSKGMDEEDEIIQQENLLDIADIPNTIDKSDIVEETVVVEEVKPDKPEKNEKEKENSKNKPKSKQTTLFDF